MTTAIINGYLIIELKVNNLIRAHIKTYCSSIASPTLVSNKR